MKEFADSVKRRWLNGLISWNQAYTMLVRARMNPTLVRTFLSE